MPTTYDGSIRINTRIETAGASTGIKTLTAGLKSFAAMVGIAFSLTAITNWSKAAKEAWSTQTTAETKLATVMRRRINATSEEIQSILDLTAAQQKLGIIGDEVQLSGAQQLATFTTTTEQLKKLIPAMNNLVAQQYGYDATTESAVNVANMMGRALEGQTGALTRVGISMSAAEENMIKYGDKTQRAAVLAEIITNNVGEMNQALAQTEEGRQKQLANVMGDVNEQFGRAITKISVLFIPALSQLANWLSYIASLANAVAQSIATAFGAETSGYDGVAESASGASSSIDDLTGSTVANTKAADKNLAVFDELNVAQQDSSNTTKGSSFNPSSAVTSGFSVPENWGSDLSDKVKKSMEQVTIIVSGAFLALGAILAFSGVAPKLGIGLMAVGAAGLAAEAMVNWDAIVDKIKGPMGQIMIFAGEQLMALGLILALSGPATMPLGIALIAAGAVAFATAVALNWDSIIGYIKGPQAKLIALASESALALGLILTLSGVATPLGIALLAAGAVGLVTVTALNWESVKDALRGPIGVVTALAGAATLALGVMLAFSGGALPLGIALIALGAASLATVTALNWNSIIDYIKGPQAGLIALASQSLLVLGLILAFSGVATPLGVALIAAGAVGLISVTALNWDAILDNLKGAWGRIKDWWSGSVVPSLTSLPGWFKQNIINPLIGGVESFINFFIDGLNWLIDRVNSISFDLPDIMGGGHIGFDLPSLDPVELPRLAQGAVIPPNREFAAILGDQTNGRNLELPESLLRQLLREELGSNGGDIQVTNKFEFNGSLAKLAQIMTPAIKTEVRRVGPSIVKVGGSSAGI